MAKIIKAKRDEWIAPVSTKTPPPSVLLFPNENFGPGESLDGWICDHAAPQAATAEGQIIVCERCRDAMNAGAEIVKDDSE
jgi:hypothetical protein